MSLILDAIKAGGRGRIDIPATRVDLAYAFAELGFTKGAEIGVETGKYSEVLLDANPDLYLRCVDAWKAYQGYREHVSQEQVDQLYEKAKQRLVRFFGRVALVRAWSVDAALDVPDRSLDFVYIDANHTMEAVIDDVDAWVPKVRRGGLVSGHDFSHDVERIVTAYASYRGYALYVLTGDRAKSWFWVAQ